jgi:hypothetical protein
MGREAGAPRHDPASAWSASIARFLRREGWIPHRYEAVTDPEDLGTTTWPARPHLNAGTLTMDDWRRLRERYVAERDDVLEQADSLHDPKPELPRTVIEAFPMLDLQGKREVLRVAIDGIIVGRVGRGRHVPAAERLNVAWLI